MIAYPCPPVLGRVHKHDRSERAGTGGLGIVVGNRYASPASSGTSHVDNRRSAARRGRMVDSISARVTHSLCHGDKVSWTPLAVSRPRTAPPCGAVSPHLCQAHTRDDRRSAPDQEVHVMLAFSKQLPDDIPSIPYLIGASTCMRAVAVHGV